MADRRSLGGAGPGSPGSSGPTARVAATDLAILTAFCRPYLDGDRRFPCPSPNNDIVKELGRNGVHLDLDALRGHLRNLYAKFGVDDGLAPAQKRARLAELVYESCVIPGWGITQERSAPAPIGTTLSPPAVATPTPSSARPIRSRAFRSLRRRWWLGAAFAVLLVGPVAVLADFTGPGPAPRSTTPLGFPIIDPDLRRNAEEITYCTGADTVTSSDGRRQHQSAIDAFNAQSDAGVTARLRQFSDDASQQYKQFRRLLLAKSDECDVIYADVVWVADFAQNKWLYDLTPYAPQASLNRFVGAMQQAVVFRNRVWGIPKQADAALLYYNQAGVKDPPSTWQEVYAQAKAPPGKRLRYQGLDYEGLTVNFLELAYAAGATDIVTPSGNANINQRDAVVALRFMVDGIKNGAVPRDVVGQTEAASLYAFGRRHRGADFMRNWSTSYAALQGGKYPKVAGKVGAIPLPGWKGGARVSVLGGHVLMVPASSGHPGAALKLIDFLSSEAAVKRDSIDFSLAPALVKLWDDRDVRKHLPAFVDLRSAVFNAKSRPVTPNYPEVSAAIYNNVNRALRGKMSPEEALDQANYEMQQALDDIGRPPWRRP